MKNSTSNSEAISKRELRKDGCGFDAAVERDLQPETVNPAARIFDFH